MDHTSSSEQKSNSSNGAGYAFRHSSELHAKFDLLSPKMADLLIRRPELFVQIADIKPPPEQFIPRPLSLAEFLATAKPPEFLVEPILQRGFLYTLTAPTFHGKTSTAIYLALAVAMKDWTFSGLTTNHGRVAFLAGENPDDTAQKFLAACDYWKTKPDQVPLNIIPGAFDLSVHVEALRNKIEAGGEVALIIADTSTAYRFDSEENDNGASKLWGQTLRTLTALPGRPSVVVPCHPVKNADRSMLLPRGGGAFLNEIDGNLSQWTDLSEPEPRRAELHWQGKLRGPSFKPISLELHMHPHPSWKYSDGRPVDLPVAVPSDYIPMTAEKASKRLPEHAEICFRILCDMPSDGALRFPPAWQMPHGMVPTCTEKLWRQAFYAGTPEDTPEARRKAFYRATVTLIQRRKVQMKEGLVWII